MIADSESKVAIGGLRGQISSLNRGICADNGTQKRSSALSADWQPELGLFRA
jgi:hypothetical protein